MKINKFTKIGGLALIAIFLLYFGLNYLKGFNIFKKQNIYYAEFELVKNVNIASPVLINGYKVGVVKTMNFDYKKGQSIIIGVDLDDKYQMPKGSKLSIHQTALSGAEVHIIQGDPQNGFLHPGDTIQTKGDSGDIMSAATNKIVPGVIEMLPKIDSTLVGLSKFVNDPNLPVLLENLAATTEQIKNLSSALNTNLSTNLPVVMKNARTITDNTVKLTEELKEIKIQPLMAELQSTSENLHAISEQIKNAEGTLGLLMKDKSLYQKLDSLAANADALVRDLKENPKRYVHFSLF